MERGGQPPTVFYHYARGCSLFFQTTARYRGRDSVTGIIVVCVFPNGFCETNEPTPGIYWRIKTKGPTDRVTGM